MKSAKDVAASAKAGMEKTKATLQEKGERMTARDPLQKELATEKKEQRIHEAERQKLEAKQHNAATAGAHTTTGGVLGGHGHTTGAGVGHPTGTDYAAEEIGGAGVGHHTGGVGHHTTGGARTTGYGSGDTY